MEQLNCVNSRWVIILPKDEVKNFPTEEFEIVYEIENLYSREYETILVELNKEYLKEGKASSITAEDVLVETGAIACHEEWTNGFLTTIEDVEKLSDLYSWSGGGEMMFAELLTENEKLSSILNRFYDLDPQKQVKSIDKLMVQLEKDGQWFPLKENCEWLFTKDVHHIKYEDEDVSCWWPEIIPADEFFLVILDDTLDDEEDEEIEKELGHFKLLPPNERKSQGYLWDDDYDYDDYKYYQHLF